MVYNVITRELRTEDGIVLKRLHCPLHKEWQQLTMIEGDDTRRHCQSCKKTVVDLSEMSDEEIELLLRRSPDCCVYIPRRCRNIRTEGLRETLWPDPCPYRRIHTARGQDEIDEAMEDGFRPLVKKVNFRRLASETAVYRNRDTREIITSEDRSWEKWLPSDWRLVRPPVSDSRHQTQYCVAAYLLPPDLRVNEQVFLLDLIETYHVYPGYRLARSYAVWNGQDFIVDRGTLPGRIQRFFSRIRYQYFGVG